MSRNVLPSGHLTAAQRAALRALSEGGSKSQAATIAGRTERTISRWIAEDAAFGDALKRATDVTIADASRRLAALLDEAVYTLEDILVSDSVAPHVKLRAVDLVVGHLVKLREHGDLSDRVAALEEKVF